MFAKDCAKDYAKNYYPRSREAGCLPRTVQRIVPRSINQDLANLDFAKNFTIDFTQYRSSSPTAWFLLQKILASKYKLLDPKQKQEGFYCKRNILWPLCALFLCFSFNFRMIDEWGNLAGFGKAQGVLKATFRVWMHLFRTGRVGGFLGYSLLLLLCT